MQHVPLPCMLPSFISHHSAPRQDCNFDDRARPPPRLDTMARLFAKIFNVHATKTPKFRASHSWQHEATCALRHPSSFPLM